VIVMKYVHACVSVMVLFAVALLPSCSGSYTDPLDGKEKSWECSDDPTPEQAKEAFAELERQKGLVDALLMTLRSGPQTPVALANIDSCLEFLERIAEAKAKLTPHLR
jgi:hypothetical protein